jgi:hypothetical protein
MVLIHSRPAMDRFPRELPRETPILLLGAAMAVAAALVLGFAWHTTYYADTWELLIDRRNPSIDTLLEPHNEHLVVIPILINELFLRVFGMTSSKPELILLVAFLLATAAMIYAYVERRVGSWLALFAAVLILFLGPAFEVLLWPFEITFIGPIFFGLAALLALERDDRRGDVAACLLLVCGLGFSNLGLPFVLGAAVAVLLGRREAWRSRLYVWAIPLALFIAWWIGWGHEATTHTSLHNLLAAPAFVANSVAVALGSLTGLGTEASLVVDTSWGRILAVALAIALAVWWRLRRPRFDRALWPILTVAVVNWVLTALNAFAGREPTSSRYQYVGAIFVLLILACLLREARPTRGWLIGGAIAVVLAVGPNIVVLHEASKNYVNEAVITRSATAAIEIAEPTVEPGFQLSPEVVPTSALINVLAGPYQETVDEYGSPAYSEAELANASETGRTQADIVLAHALPLTVTVGPGGDRSGAGCVNSQIEGQIQEIPLPPGKTLIELGPGGGATLALRRFAAVEFPVVLGSVPEESTAVLDVPRDKSTRPWYLRVESARNDTVCRPPGSQP